MDNGLWDNPRGDDSQADVQFTRMLHSETQRQLAKVTHTLTDIESRLREIENLKNYREGQVVLSGSIGNAAFKIGMVILAFALGVWGSNMFPAIGERQRSPEPPGYHLPYHGRPEGDFSNDKSHRE